MGGIVTTCMLFTQQRIQSGKPAGTGIISPLHSQTAQLYNAGAVNCSAALFKYRLSCSLLSFSVLSDNVFCNFKANMRSNPSPEAITSHADEEERIELAGTSEPKPPSTKSSTAPHHDPFLVAFDETHDTDNPLDWPMGKKWMVTDVLSATGFNRIMVSTIMAPALGTISKDLGMNPTEAAMSLSIYLLATAFGPLFIGPLSEMYGRQMVLHGSSIWFLIWNILCGFAKTKETLIASRFLAGFGASAIYSLGGGVLGDIWRPEQRGKSLSIYLLIPLLGAAVGMSFVLLVHFTISPLTDSRV